MTTRLFFADSSAPSARQTCAWGVLLASALGLGCSDSEEPGKAWSCSIPDGSAEAPDFVAQIGCAADFERLASEPLVSTLPGARSVKTSVDRESNGELSFQNSTRFPIHWDFLSEHRSVAQGLGRVPALAEFNQTEYYSPSRRFLLGALTHYEGPDRWVYEISPYDTSDATMIADAFARIRESSFIGDQLFFHPTSLNVETVAAELPTSISQLTTDDLFQGIDFQPLNVAESYGRLRFVAAEDLDTSFVTFRDIVVLDRVPNDISVTQGIITAEFQTPLSHVNVLSQNRGTPNMALRGAMESSELRALEGQWVRLSVGASDYEISAVAEAEADAWWDEHKPQGVQVPGLNDTVTDLRDASAIVPADVAGADLLAVIKEGTRAFGGKAANYAALSHVEGIRVPQAFGVPIYYYLQFMRENGFDQQVAALLADPAFTSDPAVRDQKLSELRDAMELGTVNPEFEARLVAKLEADFPATRMRFRSSTNAEDLDGFTGAGLYTSRSGELADPEDPVLDAVRRVWASVWSFRAFEERSYRSIDHTAVGMALLVHRSFPEEEANGVALTNNPFDKTGIDPAFYVNVQVGELSVVQPEPGTSTEEFLQYFDLQNQPVSYLSNSNLVPQGNRVLQPSQVQELGVALDRIRAHFAPAYAVSPWWAMDVEFKFDAEGDEVPPLFVKQARPFGNR
ncbi:MAG TPA: PEP/pyruvate-binding domain-containing protein [Polyangiaceae bacterium]|nr:PEP/pyruvate-binding domain-containing protein [Polyangiaceae bacterium]